MSQTSLKIKLRKIINILIWFKLNNFIYLIGNPLESFISVSLNHSYRGLYSRDKRLIILNLYYFTYTEITLERLFFEIGLLGVWVDVSIRLRKREE